MFTDKDAWTGGFYELCIEVGKNNKQILDTSIQTLWKVAPLVGCYPSNKQEPHEQQSVTPNLENASQSNLYSLLKVRELGEIPCAIFVVEEEEGSDWLYLSVPLGWLSENFEGVGAFPFGVEDESNRIWREPIEDTYIKIAQDLFEFVKFRVALIAWEIAGIYDLEYLQKSGITEFRGMSYLINDQGNLETYKINKWN
jgi:hypothetical protein